MDEIAKIRCPGCDNAIPADAVICRTCMRCPNCGTRRQDGDAPCGCGHPSDPQQIDRLIRRFGIREDGSSSSRAGCFRFGLRSLFVWVTMAAVGCSWVVYARSWIRQRHEFSRGRYASVEPRAPGGLWLLGEEGCGVVTIYSPAADHDLERAKELFPESRIVLCTGSSAVVIRP